MFTEIKIMSRASDVWYTVYLFTSFDDVESDGYKF